MNRYAARAEPPDSEAPGAEMWTQNLCLYYETDAELVAAVLPKPFEPTRPHVRVNFGQVELASGPLGACTFSVACRHGDLDGHYDLLMVMTTEGAVLGGRETFGEPKKLGDAALRVDGDEVEAVLSRKGVDLIRVTGRLAESLDPGQLEERFAFYYKFLLDPAGTGFDGDPALVHVRRTQQDRRRERVDAEIVLGDSPFDPVADLPVRRLLDVTYTESVQTQTGEIVRTVPADWVWPFRHQRYDGLMTAPRG